MKPYFNKQRIFDQVVRALRKQDRPSINGCLLPMYRNWDGSRCAIGHIIDDAHYTASIENTSINDKKIREIISDQYQNGVNSAQFIFLGEMQYVHDIVWHHRGKPFKDVERRFRDVAVRYNLNQKVFRE